jgi:hypothetical protein
VFLFEKFRGSQDETIKTSGAFAKALTDGAAAARKLIGPTTSAAEAQQLLTESIKETRNAAAASALTPYADALGALGIKIEDVNGLFGDQAQLNESVALIVGKLAQATGVYKGRLEDLDLTTDKSIRHTVDQIRNSGQLNDKQKALLDGTIDLTQTRNADIQALRNLAAANDEDAIAKLAAIGITTTQTDAIKAQQKALETTGLAFGFGANQAQLLAIAQDSAAKSARAAAAEEGILTGSLHDATAGFVDLESEIDKTLSLFDKLAGRPADIAKGLIDVKDKTASFAKSLKDSKGATDLNTQAGRDNVKSLTDVLGSIRDVTEAQIKSGTPVEEATKKYAEQVEALRKVAIQSGLTKKQFDFLLATLGATPEQITTDLKLSGVTEAKAALEPYSVLINALPPDKQTEIRQLGAVDAEAAVKLLNLELDKITDKEVKVKIIGEFVGNLVGQLGNALDVVGHSRGAIDFPRKYAQGGINDPRIVTAGSNVRLFGEPDTGGEAFIPLAADSRRGRAIDITSEVAGRFGFDLTQKGAMTAPAFDDSRMVNVLSQGFQALQS